MNSALTQLRNELARIPCDRDSRTIIDLLTKVGEANQQECLPVVEAISRHYPDAEVRGAASRVAALYSPSLQRMWDATVADQMSSIEERAARLVAMEQFDLTPLELIQSIFNEMKGEPLGTNDPRLAILKRWSSNCSARVNSAITFAICKASVSV